MNLHSCSVPQNRAHGTCELVMLLEYCLLVPMLKNIGKCAKIILSENSQFFSFSTFYYVNVRKCFCICILSDVSALNPEQKSSKGRIVFQKIYLLSSWMKNLKMRFMTKISLKNVQLCLNLFLNFDAMSNVRRQNILYVHEVIIPVQYAEM